MTTVTQFPYPGRFPSRSGQRPLGTIAEYRPRADSLRCAGTYLSRTALLTASLLCFAVAGVVLIWSQS